MKLLSKSMLKNICKRLLLKIWGIFQISYFHEHIKTVFRSYTPCHLQDFRISSLEMVPLRCFWKKLKQLLDDCVLLSCRMRTSKFKCVSKFKLSNCLNVKKLLAQNKQNIQNLSDCNGTRTHNDLVSKRTLNRITI